MKGVIESGLLLGNRSTVIPDGFHGGPRYSERVGKLSHRKCLPPFFDACNLPGAVTKKKRQGAVGQQPRCALPRLSSRPSAPRPHGGLRPPRSALTQGQRTIKARAGPPPTELLIALELLKSLPLSCALLVKGFHSGSACIKTPLGRCNAHITGVRYTNHHRCESHSYKLANHGHTTDALKPHPPHPALHIAVCCVICCEQSI